MRFAHQVLHSNYCTLCKRFLYSTWGEAEAEDKGRLCQLCSQDTQNAMRSLGLEHNWVRKSPNYRFERRMLEARILCIKNLANLKRLLF